MGKNWRQKMGIDGSKKARPLEEQIYARAMPEFAMRALGVLCRARKR
jgi:hypothetical protein